VSLAITRFSTIFSRIALIDSFIFDYLHPKGENTIDKALVIY
jgi:hypothetical protein